MKSTSRQIGANPLADMAAELEKAGNDGNIDLINEKTDTMLAEYIKFKDILKPYFPECAESEAAPAGAESLLPMLEQLQVALDNFDTLQIEEALEKLEGFKFPDTQRSYFDKLKKAVMDTDFDTAGKIIEEWGPKLMEADSGSGGGPEVVGQMLDKMQTALAEFDTLEIEDVLVEMSKLKYSDGQDQYFRDLNDAVESFDIDKCNEIIENWRSIIANS